MCARYTLTLEQAKQAKLVIMSVLASVLVVLASSGRAATPLDITGIVRSGNQPLSGDILR